MRSRAVWAEAGLVLMVLIWGLNFVVAKWAMAVIDPLGFNAIRHVIASVFMASVLLVRGERGLPARADIGRVVALGIVGNVVYQTTFVIGLNRTNAGNAAVILALVPIFVLLLQNRRDRIAGAAWVGALMSVAGVALVSGGSLASIGRDGIAGDLILVGAAAVWAIYTIGAQPLIERYGPIRTTAWTLWVGSTGLLFLGIPGLMQQDWSQVTPAAWGGVLFSSVFSIGVAYLLWYTGVQQLGGAHTAVFANLPPIVALAAGAIWLGEEITGYSVIGAAMVVGGVLLVRRGRRT